MVDEANILSPVTVADLERKLADLEQKSGIQLVVATVPSLGGEEIEPYANALFRAWKLGEAKKNNGVLLLVAPKERRVRIEVGYGLEGTLTDAVSSIIIANAIAPRFKAGDFNGGVTRGVDDIITALTTDSAEWKPKPTDMRAEHDASLLDTLAPFLIFLFIMFVISRVSRRGGGGNVIFIPMGTGGGFGRGGFRRRLWRRGRLWRRRRLFRRRRLVGRRRRLGRLVMILDPDATARVEAAYRRSAAQDPRAARLRARRRLHLPGRGISCSAPASSRSRRRCRCCCSPSFPPTASMSPSCSSPFSPRSWLRCRRCGGGLSRSAWRARPATGRRWRSSSCAGSTAPQCGALIYVSLAEHYIRIVPAEDAAHGDPPRAMAGRGRRGARAARRRGDGGRADRARRALRRHSRRAVPAGPSL